MEEIYIKVPCREEQLKDLFDLMGGDDEPLPCSLFISGDMGTGKSLCVETILRYLDYKYVVVDCIEFYSPIKIYENILSDLQGDELDTKCDSLMGFINALTRMANNQRRYEPIVIIFDRAERLLNMDLSIISVFLRLRELCNLNICTIFISHLIYDKFFKIKSGVREPITLFFPNYNKEELFKIISLRQKSFIRHLLSAYFVNDEIRQELERPELFTNFLNAFLSVFYRACRNLSELQHMAQVNFVEYCEPIILNEISASDLPKLWRHISPILKTSLETLYLRTSHSKSTIPSTPGKENIEFELSPSYVNKKEELMSTKNFVQDFELPYYAKFLLIAAYLASYNPPKEDKRLFMKNHGKQRKRMQQVKAKAKISEKLNMQLGPKVFTLDRLLAIFFAILEEKIGLTSNLQAQIASLVELKLIVGNKEIDLDTPKYKCAVSYDFISAVAHTVRFNINKYLYDFN